MREQKKEGQGSGKPQQVAYVMGVEEDNEGTEGKRKRGQRGREATCSAWGIAVVQKNAATEKIYSNSEKRE